MNIMTKRTILLAVGVSLILLTVFVAFNPLAFVVNGGGVDPPPPPKPTPLPYDPGYTLLPTKPVLQLITVGADNSIPLTWSAVDGATSYQVYMRKEFGTWESKVLVISTTTTIKGLTDGDYSFKVRGYHSVGYSEFSTVKLATIGPEEEVPDETPEAPVLEPIIPSVSYDGVISLKWNDVSEADKYVVYRTKEDCALELLREIDVNYYEDLVTDNSVYYYKIRAINLLVGEDFKSSDYSNEESVIVQIPGAPDVPTVNEITYEVIESGLEISVTWNEVDCNSYSLYKSVDSGDYVLIEEGLTSTSYSEILSDVGVYAYKVSATNAHGESELSQHVSIKLTEDGVALPDDYIVLFITLGVLAVLIVPIVILVKRRKK